MGAGRAISLPAPVDSSASLAPAPGGRIWVADAGVLALLDTVSGAAPVRVELGAPGPARVVGSDTAAVYVVAGGQLLAVRPDSAQVRARRSGVGESGFAPDSRAGGAYVATGNGGVLGVEAGSLQPLWSWPERGPAGTALAVSPLGDRVYHALGGDEPRILTRDAQTGRILAQTPVAGEVGALGAGPDGTLYALMGGGRGAAVAAFRPVPDGLEVRWDRPLRRLELGDSARLEVSPSGGRLALVERREGGALRVLDARTGEVVAGERGVLDAAWRPDGALLLLTTDAVRVVGPR